MKFRIAIPTIARAETIKKKTINYLAKTDIDFSEVDLFLSDGNELESYKESLKDYPINFIVTNKKHVNTQYKCIITGIFCIVLKANQSLIECYICPISLISLRIRLPSPFSFLTAAVFT